MTNNTITRNGDRTDEVFHHEGRMVAILSHPCPRAPWWLHLTADWTGNTPDVPKGSNGGWRFRTRRSARAWVADQLDQAGSS